MLSRMRELAVQASTDTLNNTDRARINLEYQASKDEITRIANATQYNEMDILNGTYYRNQVNSANSTAKDVVGVSVQALDEVVKGTYILHDPSFSYPAAIPNTGSPTEDTDSDGVPNAKDNYPNDADKVKDFPEAFLGLTSDLKLWLDASSSDAVAKNESDDVSSWYDWSGDKNHTIQTNDNSKPTFTKYQELDSIKFDGINDYLTFGNEDVRNIQEHTIFLIVNRG